MNALSVRHATTADIPLIRQLALAIWPDTYASIISAEQISYMLELMYSEASLNEQMNNHRPFVLLYEGTVPSGFASCGPVSDTHYKLHKIYILPSLQGKGAGKFLLNFVQQDARTNGAAFLELQVNKANKAKEFYERNGFIIREEMILDIGNGYVMDDYIMEKKL